MRLFLLLFWLLVAIISASSNGEHLQIELYDLTERLANLPFLFPHEYQQYLRICQYFHTIPSDAYPGFRADLLRFELILSHKPIESLSGKKRESGGSKE